MQELRSEAAAIDQSVCQVHVHATKACTTSQIVEDTCLPVEQVVAEDDSLRRYDLVEDVDERHLAAAIAASLQECHASMVGRVPSRASGEEAYQDRPDGGALDAEFVFDESSIPPCSKEAVGSDEATTKASSDAAPSTASDASSSDVEETRWNCPHCNEEFCLACGAVQFDRSPCWHCGQDRGCGEASRWACAECSPSSPASTSPLRMRRRRVQLQLTPEVFEATPSSGSAASPRDVSSPQQQQTVTHDTASPSAASSPLQSGAAPLDADSPCAASSVDAEVCWTCQDCGEENRAFRAECNGCFTGRREGSPISCKIRKRNVDNAPCTPMAPPEVGPWTPPAKADARESAWTPLARRPPAEAEAHDSNGVQEQCTSDAGPPSWSCPRCGEENRASRAECNVCGHSQCAKDSVGSPVVTSPVANASHWTCPSCDEENRASRSQCNNCGLDRSAEVSEEGFGASSPTNLWSARSWNWTPPHASGNECDDEESFSAKYIDLKINEGYEPQVAQEVIILHIYDVFADDRVQAVNNVFRSVGTGAFHAGVEAFGEEWSFGCTSGGSGITACEPKRNPCHRYREEVVMGTISMTPAEFEEVLKELEQQWLGPDYNLLTRNCCHFCDAFCRRLGVGPLPEWVSNLASAGATTLDFFSSATAAMNEAVGVAAEKAVELDERYNISSAVDSLTSREVVIDGSYFESRVTDLWSRAKANIESVGALAERAMEEVQKPMSVDAHQVEVGIVGALSQLWTQTTPAKGDKPIALPPKTTV